MNTSYMSYGHRLNSIFRDAGLKLYFNQYGVYYHVESTGQKDILLMDEHNDVLSMGAELEMLQRSLSGMDEYIDEVKSLA